jgi:D-3-phosphoglycerate dehydrogenase
MRGVELAGKVAGVVGLGSIGSLVARKLHALEMDVLAYDPYVDAGRAALFGADKVELRELVQRSDFITIHCRVTPETTGLIGPEEVHSMKRSAFLVNTAGWEVVDESSLLDALRQRRIAGAAFDVYETNPVHPLSPFLKLDNVVLTPHIGGATDGTVERYSMVMAREIETFLEGKCPRNVVNPEAWGRHG